ncbi:MAG: MarR family transcriptional regulator [Nocardioides sp.]|uniref:MarR family transcriptional regulator n=1 Tax=Nocardioides sp. TaxID=35761 RepID=UPI0039E2D702
MPAFGPQMIGATEKTLNALLRHVLAETALTEPQWVTLRLAAQNQSGAPLAALVRSRAHFADADEIIAALTRRALIADDALSPAGHTLVAELQARIAALTGPVWAELAADDVVATERVLTTVTRRVNEILDSLAS